MQPICRTKRLHMEALEKRRVLTVALGMQGMMIDLEIDVMDPDAGTAIESTALFQPSIVTFEGIIAQLPNVHVPPDHQPQSTATSALEVDTLGNQLIVSALTPISIDGRAFRVPGAPFMQAAEPLGNSPPPGFHQEEAGTRLRENVATPNRTLDIQPMLRQPMLRQPTLRQPTETARDQFGVEESGIVAALPGPAGSPSATSPAWRGLGPGNAEASPRNSLFDIPPTRSHLDVIELPLPGPEGPRPGTEPLITPVPTSGDERGRGSGLGEPGLGGPGLGGPGLGEPGLGGPADGDPGLIPRAPQFVTIDIGSNHEKDGGPDLGGGDDPIATTLRPPAVAKIDAATRPKTVASEIEMARQHRLQLAAAGRLPAPLRLADANDDSIVTPAVDTATRWAAADLLFAQNTDRSSGEWLDHWIAQTYLSPGEGITSPTSVDDEAQVKERDIPAAKRADPLIDAHSANGRSPRSGWQWAIDALLACGGTGALILHDRYGHLSEQSRIAPHRLPRSGFSH
jgi:hypothetical protein